MNPVNMPMNLRRRRFLASLLAAAAVLPLAQALPLPARVATRAAARAATVAGPREGFFLVNGWILTAADVRALKLQGAEQSRIG